MKKLCVKSKIIGCGRELDVSKFYANGNYRQPYCKECLKTYQQSLKSNKPTGAEAARLMCNKLIKEKQ